MTQASVLFLIKQNGELTLTEIAKRLGVSKSAATQLTEALIEQNLLIKKPDTIDRRVSRLTLSPKCGQQLKVFRTQAMSGLAKIFENLEDNELEELKKITNKLAEKGETDNV
jgi:DNA-binding MarR family transcriptional regulator